MKTLSMRQLKKKIRQCEKSIDTAKTEAQSYFYSMRTKIASPLNLGLFALGGFVLGGFLPKLLRRNSRAKKIKDKINSKSRSLFDFAFDLVAAISAISALTQMFKETTEKFDQVPPPSSSEDHHKDITL